MDLYSNPNPPPTTIPTCTLTSTDTPTPIRPPPLPLLPQRIIARHDVTLSYTTVKDETNKYSLVLGVDINM
jgi:hypothetical protein